MALGIEKVCVRVESFQERDQWMLAPTAGFVEALFNRHAVTLPKKSTSSHQ
jgi:hypothetical protein